MKSIKVVIIGLENSGKTSLLKAVSKNEGLLITPTLGFNIGELNFDKSKGIVFEIGGKSKHLWKNYVPKSSVVIFVIDSSDVTHNVILKQELEALVGVLESSSLLIFLLNKIDKKDCMSVNQFIEEFRIFDMFANDMFLQSVSAIDGTGVGVLMKKINHFLKIPIISIN